MSNKDNKKILTPIILLVVFCLILASFIVIIDLGYFNLNPEIKKADSLKGYKSGEAVYSLEDVGGCDKLSLSNLSREKSTIYYLEDKVKRPVLNGGVFAECGFMVDMDLSAKSKDYEDIKLNLFSEEKVEKLKNNYFEAKNFSTGNENPFDTFEQ